MAPDHSAAIVARPQVLELLRGLHDISAAQESSFAQRWFYFSRLVRFLFFHQTWSSGSDIHMQDKLVALDEDKCHFMYLIARSMGVRNAVEAGTSHGVSTIYLALAVGQNVENLRKVSGDQSISGKVIATEKESSKASKAREHWKTAGSEVEPWIELREGNLLETLKDTDSLPDTIDLLLLDIWTPLALPTLKLVTSRLRRGAMVITDNTVMASSLYGEFLTYMRDPENGFKNMNVPFSGGLEVSVYLPKE